MWYQFTDSTTYPHFYKFICTDLKLGITYDEKLYYGNEMPIGHVTTVNEIISSIKQRNQYWCECGPPISEDKLKQLKLELL